MNKSTIVFAALALLAASCTKTEVVNGAQEKLNGIGFSAYTAKHTKAAQTDVVTGNFNSFEVSAIGNGAIYFDNVTFEKNAEGVWASTPVYFWPAYKLNFYAYNTPAHGHFSRAISTDAQTLSFKPSTVLAEQEDLVAAYAADQTQPVSGATALTFDHYLTQLVVNAKSSNDNYKVEVSGVKVANLKDSLTFTFSTGNAAVSAGAVDQDYTSEFGVKTLSSDAYEVMVATGNGKWYLVPQTVTAWNQETDKTNTSNGTYLALKVKITSKGGAQIYPKSGDSAWMAVPVPTELAFAQGKKYNVTLDFFKNKGAGYVDPEVPSDLDGDGNADNDKGMSILGGVIKFDATVDAWDTVNIKINL